MGAGLFDEDRATNPRNPREGAGRTAQLYPRGGDPPGKPGGFRDADANPRWRGGVIGRVPGFWTRGMGRRKDASTRLRITVRAPLEPGGPDGPPSSFFRSRPPREAMRNGGIVFEALGLGRSWWPLVLCLGRETLGPSSAGGEGRAPGLGLFFPRGRSTTIGLGRNAGLVTDGRSVFAIAPPEGRPRRGAPGLHRKYRLGRRGDDGRAPKALRSGPCARAVSEPRGRNPTRSYVRVFAIKACQRDGGLGAARSYHSPTLFPGG